MLKPEFFGVAALVFCPKDKLVLRDKAPVNKNAESNCFFNSDFILTNKFCSSLQSAVNIRLDAGIMLICSVLFCTRPSKVALLI